MQDTASPPIMVPAGEKQKLECNKKICIKTISSCSRHLMGKGMLGMQDWVIQGIIQDGHGVMQDGNLINED